MADNQGMPAASHQFARREEISLPGPRPRACGYLGCLMAAIVLALAGCGSQVEGPDSSLPSRPFRMGFSAIPPRADFDVLLRSLDLWMQRADAAIIHINPQWDSLLAGVPADVLVRRDPLPLAEHYRAHGLVLAVTLDATDGLNRAAEAPGLVAAGRSLTEPEVQELYRHYAVAIDTLLRPDYLGLAAETNLIRAAAAPELYAAVKQAANDAAAGVRAADPTVRRYVSVQVEVAWGALGGIGSYVGVATDLADFPFTECLGLSSYPYLGGFDEPEEVPLDYYARLAAGTTLPALVVEGGWTSASVGPVISTPQKQARWIRHQVRLLDEARAVAVFQLTFTDLDLVSSPPPPGSILPLFAALGLVDTALAPKPALAPWDSAWARARE